MKIRYIVLLLIAATFTCKMQAQAPHSSYFMENMPTRHLLNPAFTPDFNYVSLPVLGNMQVRLNSNVGLGAFLYPNGDELVTGLNQIVSADEFLDNLHKKNTIEADIRVNLVSFGFSAWGGYNTFDLSARSITGVYLPYELFEFAKVGQINGNTTQYNIKNLGVQTSNYAEFAFGHSRKITDRLTAGAKVKFLAGILHSKAKIENLDVYMSGEKWEIKESGELFTTNGLDIQYKENGEIDDFDTGTFGMDGAGLGFDLGATYRLLDNLTVSAALTDIGFISWKGSKATAKPDAFVFDGFHHLGAEDDPVTGESALDKEADQIEEDLRSLIRFQNDNSARQTRSLTTTLNLGGEYSILNDKISFGLLSSTRFGMPRVWTELMASANFNPVSWFSATVNGSVSNIAQSMGVLLNFTPKGFNFFIGSDYIPFKYGKQGIPVNQAKLNYVMGINFTFNHKSDKNKN